VIQYVVDTACNSNAHARIIAFVLAAGRLA
jgi:hypothetical protein